MTDPLSGNATTVKSGFVLQDAVVDDSDTFAVVTFSSDGDAPLALQAEVTIDDTGMGSFVILSGP